MKLCARGRDLSIEPRLRKNHASESARIGLVALRGVDGRKLAVSDAEPGPFGQTSTNSREVLSQG